MGNEFIKKVSMITLVIQNSSLALFMRYSRIHGREGALYAATTAVVNAELIKVIVSLLLQLKDEGGLGSLMQTINRDIVSKPVEMLKMFVPAGLYCVQNNLAYIAISHLDGPTYQLLYQLKILTTALFSVFMLNKVLTSHQWLSLFLLAFGVTMVQLSNTGESTEQKENSIVGLIAVLSACMTSGFAGVYFEKVLKTSKVSIWIRNVQLASYGFLIGLGGVYSGPDAVSVKENGFFHGYNWTVWGAVLLNSLGGLVVAMVVKYADNVVKGFATSISILMTCVVSFFLFDFVINLQFLLGAILVLYSTYLYGKPSNPNAKKGGIEVVKSTGEDAERLTMQK